MNMEITFKEWEKDFGKTDNYALHWSKAVPLKDGIELYAVITESSYQGFLALDVVAQLNGHAEGFKIFDLFQFLSMTEDEYDGFEPVEWNDPITIEISKDEVKSIEQSFMDWEEWKNMTNPPGDSEPMF
jgi:hypothetical protein